MARALAQQTNGQNTPGRRPNYYDARDVASLVGISLDQFYKPAVRERLHATDKLPRPYCSRPLRWHRGSVDAWLLRFHPAMPQAAPANDVAERQDMSDEAWRERLADAYR